MFQTVQPIFRREFSCLHKIISRKLFLLQFPDHVSVQLILQVTPHFHPILGRGRQCTCQSFNSELDWGNVFLWGGGGRCPKFETPLSWDSHVTLAYEDHLLERMKPQPWASPNLQIASFQERHIEWSIRAVASSGKAERIHKLASWVSDIQEILPRGGQETCAFNVDKWPLPIQNHK